MKKSSYLSNLSHQPSHSQLSNISDPGNNIQSCDSSFENSQKGRGHSSFMNFSKNKNFSQLNSENQSFCSQINDFKMEEMLDDQLILQQKVEKRDIMFSSKCLKQSFVKYFTQIFFTFLKSPNDLSFNLALQRLKYYSQQTPFKKNQKQVKLYANGQNTPMNSKGQNTFRKTFPNYSQTQKSQSKQKQLEESSKQSTSSEQNLIKKQNSNLLNLEQILTEMFYKKKYIHMIFTFDVLMCHLTFLSLMLYYWSMADQQSRNLTSSCSSYKMIGKQIMIESILQNRKSQISIFQVFSVYIQERPQSININQINILIVFFFLNYLNGHKSFRDQKYTQKITKLEQNLMTHLKLYRRIKKMQRQFSHTSNQILLESQLHKYQYQHKLINNLEKTISYIQLLNTHNFVSSPFQKYYQMLEYDNSRKLYHLKKDYFCIWVLNIILRVCQKKNSQSLSKSAYYVISLMAILKKFKDNCNFQGMSLILPVIYNLKQLLPKVWNYALSRRSQIDQRLTAYSSLLSQKRYKVDDLPSDSNAIIDEQVIYQMSERFRNFVKEDNQSCKINLTKHQKFYLQFISHIVYHRTKIQKQYSNQIQNYKKERQIGVSFNIYLLDTYLWKSLKGSNLKTLWANLSQKAKSINKEMKEAFYIDFIDYCFIGSSIKFKQLDI